MKKLIFTFSVILLSLGAFAQAPQKMSYQAVIRNSSDALVTNTTIGMQISILQGETFEIAVYVETQTPKSNANGLVTIEIGNGTVISGDFADIDWTDGPYYIKTETDPAGGANYTITGTSQLLSVPYALHAKTAEIFTGTITESQTLADVIAIDNLANAQIKNVTDPTDDQDAATKAYVDALLARIEALENSESILLANGFTDDRDGNHYKAVKIGNQIWMAENLKYLPNVVGPTTGSNTIPCYYVYDYNGTDVDSAKATANYATYGVLYNWSAAMADSASSAANPSGVQGVCPCGWHLPSDAEWTQLTDYLGGEDIAGGKLKATTHWNSPNIGATNSSGFTALPGGYRYYHNGTFFAVGGGGLWWSSTEFNINNAFVSCMYNDYGGEDRDNINKENGFSVRCLRD